MSNLAEAAGVLLTRGPGSLELYVVRRNERLRAFGGFHAFPGGKVAPGDGELASAAPNATRIGAAARELK